MSDGSKGPLAPPSPNVWACHDLRDQDRKYWQARAGELKVSEDDRTSKAATTWAATLSTLAGVTAIFAILESYDRIAALPRSGRFSRSVSSWFRWGSWSMP